MIQAAREEEVHHKALLKELALTGEVEIVPLKFGDYLFYGSAINGIPPTICIEHGTLANITNKMQTGELAYQISGMLESYDINVLLIEGRPTQDNDGYVKIYGASRTGMKWERFHEILRAAQGHGVRVDYSTGPKESARAIRSWYQWFTKPVEEHKFFRPQKTRPQLSVPIGPALDNRLVFLMGIPGVGEARALEALKQYGSALILLTRTEKELATIPLWGKKTAKAVREFLDESV
jgi:ERCC4-type nuclease